MLGEALIESTCLEAIELEPTVWRIVETNGRDCAFLAETAGLDVDDQTRWVVDGRGVNVATVGDASIDT